MTEFKGVTVSQGIADGTIFYVANNDLSKSVKKVENSEEEIKRLIVALDKASEELMALYKKALSSADDSVADIFMIHGMMIQDDDFRNRIIELIKQDNISAENAVSQASKEFAKDLSDSGSDYIAQRGADISDVEQRIITILSGKNTFTIPADKKIVLVAEEITPSMTLMIDKSRLQGFISVKGSSTSHAAILARSLGIPAVIVKNVVSETFVTGENCIVDGIHGSVTIAPGKKQMDEALKEKEIYEQKQRELMSLCSLPAETKDGKKILLYSNAGSQEDIDKALECGTEGIGLFRTEFLYLGRSELPSEEELVKIFTKAVQKLDGRRLIIRTLDLGADKITPCIPLKSEPNPALGIRGLRLCFSKPDIFSAQLRAILRATKNGHISIMFPMISSVSEIRRAKACVLTAANELEKEGIPHAEKLETGIMIETPAAAVISDLLAKEVDFFSIGSNDLTQYTLAVDRQNEDAAAYCDVHHEGVLRLIELTIKNAHENGIWCGICGELGADTSLTDRFLKAGIDELSVSPGELLNVKKKIRTL